MSRLPSEYQEVEYLQSSGTQWIDTGITGTIDTSYELIYSQTSIGNIFGHRDAAASNNISFWTGNPDIFYLDFNNSDYDTYRVQVNGVSSYFNNKLKIECSKSLRKITNLDTSTVLGQNAILNNDTIITGNLYLFNMNGSPYRQYLPSVKLYSCKISNDSTLQRNFIPCYRKSDNVAGMYDLITNQFFTNQGTGTFIVGEDIIDKITTNKTKYVMKRLPNMFQEVEYLESSGTQYIDLGYYPSYLDEFEFKYAFTNSTVNKYNGSWESSFGSVGFGHFVDNRGFAVSSSHGDWHSFSNNYDENFHTYYANIGSGLCRFDNLTYQGSSTSDTSNKKFYILGFNSSSVEGIGGKLKEGKWWRNGVLTQHLIPCYRKSDSVAGMYDIANTTPNQQANPHSGSSTLYGITVSADRTRFHVTGTGTANDYGRASGFAPWLSNKIINGHKYYVYASGAPSNLLKFYDSGTGAMIDISSASIFSPTGWDASYSVRTFAIKDKVYNENIDVQIIDLTMMYGEGNEPTTIAEFKQRLGVETIPIYDYNPVFYTNSGTGTFIVGKDKGVSISRKTLYVIGSLPDEYQELEYLESSGTQWIDTGVNTDNNLGIEFEYKFNNVGIQRFGAIKQQVEGVYIRHHVNGGESGSGYYFYTSLFSISGDINKHYMKLDTFNKTFTFDNTISSIPLYTFDLQLNYWLFRRNSNIEGLTNYANLKLYYFKITNENNTLVRNFVPCYRKSDSVAGMYDLITNQFFTNQGTGTFILGPSVAKVCESILCNIKQDGHNLPSQYQEVEFLQSQPSYNTVINTGIKLNQNSKVETKMFTFNNSVIFLYGAREAFQSNAFACFHQWAPFGSDAGSGYCEIPSLHPVLIEQSKDGIYIDGVLNHTYGTQTFETPITCTIFNCQQGTIPGSYYKPNCVNAKCYYFKIYENNTLVFNGIPCYRKSDNEPGMYDLVTNTFFTNSGTGTFIVGPDKKIKLVSLKTKYKL